MGLENPSDLSDYQIDTDPNYTSFTGSHLVVDSCIVDTD